MDETLILKLTSCVFILIQIIEIDSCYGQNHFTLRSRFTIHLFTDVFNFFKHKSKVQKIAAAIRKCVIHYGNDEKD